MIQMKPYVIPTHATMMFVICLSFYTSVPAAAIGLFTGEHISNTGTDPKTPPTKPSDKPSSDTSSKPSKDTPSPPTNPSDKPNWEFQLYKNSYITNYGLLSLRPNKTAQWGTVCNTDFSTARAFAACRTVGFSNVTAATVGRIFKKNNRDQNTSPIYDVKCKQDSPTLLQDCDYTVTNSCDHSSDVWLQCGKNPLTHVLDFKLEEEPSLGITGDPRIGRMKVKTTVNGPYEDICGSSVVLHPIYDTGATAACRTLGFDVTHAGRIAKMRLFSRFHYAMYDVSCPNGNNGLQDCTYKLDPENRVSKFCLSPLFLDCHERHPEKWKFRIEPDANGKSPSIGRLEMQPDKDKAWGTVCSNMFNDYSALMMCKAIGFADITSASAILNYSSVKSINRPKNPIYLTDVVCDENSTSLTTCTYAYNAKGISLRSVCNDMTDVGIDCSGTSTPIPTNTGTDPKTPPTNPSDKPSSDPSSKPSKDKPSKDNPSKDTPSKDTPSKDTHQRPPSGIFTATVSDNSDTFKTRLTVYMGISPSSVEVLSFDSNSHQVKFRFIDHDGPKGTPSPKALETKLLKIWGENHVELMKETGISLIHGPVTAVKSPKDGKGSSDLPIVLGVIGAVVLVGLAVGGIIVYKRRSKKTSGFVRGNDNYDYVPLEVLNGDQ